MVTQNKSLGLLRGGQITAIVGWAIQLAVTILLLAGTLAATGGEGATFITIAGAIALALPTLAFILSLAGWNKFGLSIAAGVLYIIGAILGITTIFGIGSGLLLLIGGILILCGAKHAK